MQKWIEKINKGIDQINKIAWNICAGMVFFMMLLGTADVIGRYFLNHPINGTLEIFEILLPGIILLGLGYCQATGVHVRLEFLTSRLSPRLQVIIDLFITIVMVVFSILIAWQGIMKVVLYYQIDRVISNIHLPLFIPVFFVPLGFISMCIVLITQMFQLLTKIRKKDGTKNTVNKAF